MLVFGWILGYAKFIDFFNVVFINIDVNNNYFLIETGNPAAEGPMTFILIDKCMQRQVKRYT